jgi:5-methyltetrahydropteroyltriglutamate--homocysteine methyltransferase
MRSGGFYRSSLALKLDPSGGLLNSFIELNNRVFDGFTPAERRRIGAHACPGGDRDSTHSADVDYVTLLPSLFRLNVGRFYLQLSSEPNRRHLLAVIQKQLKPGVLVFVGVTDPINPAVETSEQVRDRVLEQPNSFPLNFLERPMIVGSRLSQTTPRRRARRLSRKFSAALRGRTWRRRP